MRDSHRRHSCIASFIGAIAFVSVLAAGAALAAEDLTEMSLEELLQVKVTSVTKREQSKADAAAAISVLTHEDIRRSGATSVPEALRLVPGLHVARIDAHRWAIGARGYNGQFANKLLVLIDGRVVYTPLFGGVYWDVQDVVLEDIDRIEVIRGPGGTLWGANAVNGVINITTKSATESQGVHAMGLVGNQEYVGEARYGGMIGDHTGYRVYARGFKRDDFMVPDVSIYPADDEWWQWRVGMRADSQLGDDDLVTIQGDFYDGEEGALGGLPFYQPTEDEEFRGGNLLTRWTHAFSETQSTEVQAYWDRTRRSNVANLELRDSVDVQAQHNFSLGSANQWLFNWGVEYFWTGDENTPGVGSSYDPLEEDFHRFSGFLQAQWNLFDADLQLVAGTKLEYNNYTDFEYQPTGRVLWKFLDGHAVWAAVSRAVRSPTRSERDINYAGLITGNKDLESEDLTAYEFGYRNYMLENLTLDLTAFFNDYDDFGTLMPHGFQLDFENAAASKAWGVEVEVSWAPVDGLRLVTSYAYLQVDDDLPTTAVITAPSAEDSSPRHTWMLRGMWNLPWAPVELDSTLWYVGKLDAVFDPTVGVPFPIPGTWPTIPSYWRLDARVGWQALDWLKLEAVGQNLTDQLHIEWGAGPIALFPGTRVPRSYYGKVTLTF